MFGHEKEQVEALLNYGKLIDPKELFPVVVPEAQGFALQDPYAFAMGVCLDRGQKADIIWSIPYYINQKLGHVDPYRIYRMSLDELLRLFYSLPKGPRYINDAPRTVRELTDIVIREFDGEASRIWKDKRAEEVKRTFRSIFGVGPGIANMSVLLIEKAYGIRFSDLDRRGMDIKADTHTMRVLYRMGLSPKESQEAAEGAARRLHPEYPGELDAPLWKIGRTWCHYGTPRCWECRVREVCKKVGVT